MAINPGQKLGAYEIVSLIGKGGMGEVYKALDKRLNRFVAIKVLPERVSHDIELKQRFEREAQTLASMSHPHVCPVFDVGQHDGTDFIVMEFLEGPTLAQRLEKGALPLDQALKVACEIADALDKAHRQGIVHRDLKPGNVMLVKTGAKLLDFGLAKLKAPEAAPATLSAIPTRADMTAQGSILGTLQYMAPEQLEGRDADSRTDIFGFGEIVYEMVTGRRVFEGKSQASLIAAILEHQAAPMSSTQRVTPPALERVVQGCLEKDPEDRWQSARDVLRQLRGVTAEAVVETTPTKTGSHIRERAAWILLALAIIAAVASFISRPVPPDAPEMRLEVATPLTDDPTAFAISPDGRKLVYQANTNGKSQLWLRSLDSDTAQPIAGTDDATLAVPFWSPDSESIAFTAADGLLKRIDIASGLLRTLTAAAFGGTWNKDGVVLFARTDTGPLRRIPASGGDIVEVTRVQPPQITGHWNPHFLPDGNHFVFWGWGTPENKGVYVGSLDSTDTRRLFDSDAQPVFAAPNYVLFPRQKALMAQRLDLKTLQPAGEPTVVAARVFTQPFQVAASASASGTIAYRAAGPERQLVWLDRSGRQTGVLGEADAFISRADVQSHLTLSPDGKKVAIARNPVMWQDVWLVDVATGVPQPFTYGTANKFNPLWSPKGDRLMFVWDPEGLLQLYEKPLDGAGNGTLFFSSSEHKATTDWSRDGKYILFDSASQKTGMDIWAVPYASKPEERKPIEVARGPFEELGARFSADGRWVAFQSNETGRYEVIVQPFPGSGIGRKRITRDGGNRPQWRADGRELFYIAPDNRLMSVPMSINASSIAAGNPVALFALPPQSDFAVSGDGQRFLVNKIVKDASPITILLNWKPK